MSSQFGSYPAQLLLKVPTAASLPIQSADGTLALALDSDVLYVFNAGSMTWLTIASPTSAIVLVIGNIDSQVASANGAVIAGPLLVMQSASATVPGLVNNTTQTFSGDKTFTSITTVPAIGKTKYVSKSGSDVTGTGSAISPFLTVGAALASIVGAAEGDPGLIKVGPGDFEEAPSLALKSWVMLEGSGFLATNVYTADFSPLVWAPTGFNKLECANISLYSGLSAIAVSGATNTQLTLRNVAIFSGSLTTQGGRGGNGGGLMQVDIYDSDFRFTDSVNLNSSSARMTNCLLNPLIVTPTSSNAVNNNNTNVLLNTCRHLEISITSATVERNFCASVGGFPAYSLTNATANLILGVDTGSATNQVFVDIQADFTASSDVMTTADPDLVVGFGVRAYFLPVNTTIIADLGGGMWQLSAAATTTVTNAWTKITRVDCTGGGKPDTKVNRNAKAFNEFKYIPRDSATWGVDVPSFPTDALDILAESKAAMILATTYNNGLVQAIFSDPASAGSGLVIGSDDSATDTATKAVTAVSGSLTGASTTANTGAVGLWSGNIVDGSGDTGNVFLSTGGVDTGSGNSGDISLDVGGVDSGTRGIIEMSARLIDLDPDVETRFSNKPIKQVSGLNNFLTGHPYASQNTDFYEGQQAEAIVKDSDIAGNTVPLFGTSDSALDAGTKHAMVATGALTGAATTTSTGELDLVSGVIVDGASGTTGTVYISSGTVIAGNASSGSAQLSSGDVNGTGFSGPVNISVGQAPSGTRGNLQLNVNYIANASSDNNGHYVESQYFSQVTLLASQTATIVTQFSIVIVNFDSQQIEYTIKEATTNAVRTGRLMVCTDGTVASLTDLYTETADVGVTWSTDVNAGNLRVKYTTTANNKAMRANVLRIGV